MEKHPTRRNNRVTDVQDAQDAQDARDEKASEVSNPIQLAWWLKRGRLLFSPALGLWLPEVGDTVNYEGMNEMGRVSSSRLLSYCDHEVNADVVF